MMWKLTHKQTALLHRRHLIYKMIDSGGEEGEVGTARTDVWIEREKKNRFLEIVLFADKDCLLDLLSKHFQAYI